MLNMCKQHSCELFGNLQRYFPGSRQNPVSLSLLKKVMMTECLYVPHRNVPLQQCQQDEACGVREASLSLRNWLLLKETSSH